MNLSKEFDNFIVKFFNLQATGHSMVEYIKNEQDLNDINSIELIKKLRKYYNIYYDFSMKDTTIGSQWNEKDIAINPKFNNVERIRALVHEMAHSKIKHVPALDDNLKREYQEIEAEIITYLVLNYFGYRNGNDCLFRCAEHLNRITIMTNLTQHLKSLSVLKLESLSVDDFFNILQDDARHDVDIRTQENKKEILDASMKIIEEMKDCGVEVRC